MGRSIEEYYFSLFKRQKLINMLNESGFVIVDNENGQHVYVTNPRENYPRIEGHCLPVAVIRRFFYKLVNLNEPALKPYHDRLREIHLSIAG